MAIKNSITSPPNEKKKKPFIILILGLLYSLDFEYSTF